MKNNRFLDRENLRMSATEFIKFLHSVEGVVKFASWLHQVPELLETYHRLTEEQQEMLSRQTDVLEAYQTQQRQPHSERVLIRLASLSVANIRGSSDPLAIFAPNQVGFTTNRLGQASGWVRQASKVINFMQRLNLQEQQNLVNYAQALNVPIVREHLNSIEVILSSLALLATDLPAGQEIDEQIVLAYRTLPTLHGRDLASYAIKNYEQNPSDNGGMTEDILLNLACFVPDSLQGIHEQLVELEIFYPGELFRGTDAQTRDKLFDLINVDAKNRNHILVALAWVGDEVVQKRFQQWRKIPPVWSSEIYVSPANYAQVAGWFLTENGEREELYYQDCYELVSMETEAAHRGDIVGVITPHEEECGWCGQQLVNLFDFNLQDSQLDFLGLTGRRLRIAMCERCTCYSTIFMEVDTEGHSRWSSLNQKPNFIGHEDNEWTLPQKQLVLGKKRRTPFEAHPFVLREGMSQIGGHPAWLQDAHYPECLKCNQPMPFIGQLQTADLDKYAEGVTYAFFCVECGLAATHYQQT